MKSISSNLSVLITGNLLWLALFPSSSSAFNTNGGLANRSNLTGIRTAKSERSPWLTLSLQAEDALSREQFSEAESFYKKALTEAKRPGQSIYRIVDSLRNLSAVQEEQGKYQESEQSIRDAIALLSKLPAGSLLVECQQALGRVLAEQKKYTEADAVFRRSLTVGQLWQWKIYLNRILIYGHFCKRHGDYAEAEKQYKLALAHCQKFQKKPGLMEVDCYCYLIDLYNTWKKPLLAYDTCQKILSKFSSLDLAAHAPFTAQLLRTNNLLCTSKSWPQSEKQLRQTVRLLQNGPALDYMISCAELGLLMQRMQKKSEAEHYLSLAATAPLESSEKNSTSFADILINLAIYQEKSDKLDKAENNLKQALSIYRTKLGSNDPNLCNVMLPYARVLRKLHRDSEAATFERQSEIILHKSPIHP
jgi:tetratricopeptide (TPR) repeat protein